MNGGSVSFKLTGNNATKCNQCQWIMNFKPGLFTGTDIDGKYRIVSVLGQGGMGTVYRLSFTLGKTFALKVTNFEKTLQIPIPTQIFRFKRERKRLLRSIIPTLSW